jgi:lauroyl-KDO2-lipid IV(A) myristoyltransferase
MSRPRTSPAASGAPHRPRLEPAHFAPRYWGTWLGLGLLWLLQILPRPVTRALVPLLAWLLRRGSPKRRRFAEINLRWCFPELAEERRDALLREHFRCAAQCLLDYGMLWFGNARTHERLIEVEGGEHFRHLVAEGRSAILLVPHSLALDHGGLRLSQIVDGVSFVKPMRNRVVEWLNQRSRSRYRADMFAREQGLRPVIREMRKGRFFYYLPDEDLGADSAIFVDFFGVPKATLTSLARVARMTRADVLPTFAYYDRERDRYVLKVWPHLRDYPSGDEAADAAAMNAAIERCIREAPAQYLWTMRLFRTRPGGVPGPYRADSDTRRPTA